MATRRYVHANGGTHQHSVCVSEIVRARVLWMSECVRVCVMKVYVRAGALGGVSGCAGVCA